MAAEPFATVDQLVRGWRALDDDERMLADELLARASRKIRRTCPAWRTAERDEPGLCGDIACAMVKRAMLAAEANPYGRSQESQTTGPFADSCTYSNPDGALYLTSGEIADLTGPVGHAFTIGIARGRERGWNG